MVSAFATNGLPILYYGWEQAICCRADQTTVRPTSSLASATIPAPRRAVPTHPDASLYRLWLSGYQTRDKSPVAHVTALVQVFKTAIKASNAFLSTPVHLPPSADDRAQRVRLGGLGAARALEAPVPRLAHQRGPGAQVWNAAHRVWLTHDDRRAEL